MFVIVVGLERVAAGSIGYWEKEWRGQQVCNDWRLDLFTDSS